MKVLWGIIFALLLLCICEISQVEALNNNYVNSQFTGLKEKARATEQKRKRNFLKDMTKEEPAYFEEAKEAMKIAEENKVKREEKEKQETLQTEKRADVHPALRSRPGDSKRYYQ